MSRVRLKVARLVWKCRWAAIASYLPERTDNDIKNYWNTHLKKKFGKVGEDGVGGDAVSSDSHQSMAKGQWERRLQTDIHMAKQALREALSMETPAFMAEVGKQPSSSHSGEFNSVLTRSQTMSSSSAAAAAAAVATYASSAENISRLLQGWMRNTETPAASGRVSATRSSSESTQLSSNNTPGDSACSGGVAPPTTAANGRVAPGGLHSLARFESFSSALPTVENSGRRLFQEETKPTPLSLLLETWLLDAEEGGTGPESVLGMSLDNNTVELF